MTPRTAATDDMHEEHKQQHCHPFDLVSGSPFPQTLPLPQQQQQRYQRQQRTRLQRLSRRRWRQLLRPRHLGSSSLWQRLQSYAYAEESRRHRRINKVVKGNKRWMMGRRDEEEQQQQEEGRSCTLTVDATGLWCEGVRDRQDENLDGIRRPQEQNSNNNASTDRQKEEEGGFGTDTEDAVDNIAIASADGPCLLPMEESPLSSPSVSSTPSRLTIPQRTLAKDDGPSTRFEVLERLGYGSSGSSVFKARDRWNGFNTVAIKKIPLAALTDSFSLSKDYQVPQEEIDYFVSWIVDHCGDNKESTLAFPGPEPEPDSPIRESPGAGNDDDPGSGTSNGEGGGGSIDEYYPYPKVQRRRRSSASRENVRGLDQLVKCLGCHRNDTELWITLELCGGGSVADLIRLSDGPMTESEIGWIMGQTLLGLAYLHSKDHVHGDIKASNIMLTLDGRVKLGGSGSVMSHKEGAGERKRRRRSLTMSEFPASWLAPESNLSPPTSPTDSNPGSSLPLSMGGGGGSDGVNEMRRQQQYRLPAMPGASAEVDVWALGVSCIELSQGRPPRPETAILASYGDWRFTTTLGNIASIAEASSTATVSSSKSNGWCLPSEAMETVGMGMSEEMWTFIRKCLTPDPEARPTVQELLKDPFIVQHGELSQELLTRIRSMVDFVDQCASISEGLLLGSTGSTTSSSNSLCSLTSSPGSTTTASSTSSSSLTLSPSKATHMIDFKMDEADWLIPRIHPRVDSVYDESSFFDEAGVPKSPPGSSESSCFQPLPVLSDWKHQRISHPKVKQTLMCDQSRYLVFRHSRSPSLATIVEHQMEEDDTIFWTDNDNDKVDDTDDCNSDKDIGTNRNTLDRQGRKEESFQHPGNFHPHYKHGFIQDNQSQGQNNNRDKGDMETVTTEATVHIAHEVVYLDNLTIEYGCGLKSFMEYDLHGASSRLIVLYEIHESCLQ